MNKWIAEFELEDGDTMPEHMDLQYKGGIIDFHCRPMWIPCSERLPEKDGRYLVARHDDVSNTEFIDILWYEENLWWNRRSTGDYAVTAWMPMPEPWRGGEDGNQTE